VKVTYVTNYDVFDLQNWSGTGFYISKSLINAGVNLDYIDKLDSEISFISKCKRRLYSQVGKKFDVYREPSILKNYAQQIERRLTKNTDILFSPGTLPLAYVDSKLPKVIYTDATFASMVNFYDEFTNFADETIRHANLVEQRALQKAQLVIYSSEWAANSAINDYCIDPAKILVVPFGANFVSDFTNANIGEIIKKRNESQCFNFLFAGVDWNRKGGDKAVLIIEKLREYGLNVELHILGISDLPMTPIPCWVKNHGYINKANSEGLDKIKELFASAHFFLLPTVADCTPVVFSEANSFGVPCITTNVGGISTIIEDGINGKTFDLKCEVEVYATYLHAILTNKRVYEELAHSSYATYTNKLNWKETGRIISKALAEL
jgi:glycosyltransferase involved in cell wall biosynthesis